MDGIEVEHALGDVLEKPAIVADDEKRRRLRCQQLLEPEDAVEVEMVRRLVQQQQVGRCDERPRDGEALLPAARERRRRHVGIGEARSGRGSCGRGRSRVGFVEVAGGERRPEDCRHGLGRSGTPDAAARRRAGSGAGARPFRRRAPRARRARAAASTCRCRSGRRARCGRRRGSPNDRSANSGAAPKRLRDLLTTEQRGHPTSCGNDSPACRSHQLASQGLLSVCNSPKAHLLTGRGAAGRV